MTSQSYVLKIISIFFLIFDCSASQFGDTYYGDEFKPLNTKKIDSKEIINFTHLHKFLVTCNKTENKPSMYIFKKEARLFFAKITDGYRFTQWYQFYDDEGAEQIHAFCYRDRNAYIEWFYYDPEKSKL